jgi:uncharacterized protein (TIGR02996 family)
MPDLPELLAAIRVSPDDNSAWLALAGWLRDNGRNDESDTMRVFWPALRDGLEDRSSVDFALEHVRRHVERLGWQAREIEERAHRLSSDSQT